MYLGVIRSRPTAYWSNVAIQHNHLNSKNVIQNQYKFSNNINLTYSTFIHCNVNLRSINNVLVSKLISFLTLFCRLMAKIM